jgi:hypothetical protein
VALPAIALLAIAGVAVIAMSGKKGSGGLRLFDGQCRLIKRKIQTQEDWLRLLSQAAASGQRAWKNVTGVDPGDYSGREAEYLQRFLGDAPGDVQRNQQLCRAVGTEMIKITATPACLRKSGIPSDYGATSNPFGPDWTGHEGLAMGDLAEGLHELTNGFTAEVAKLGYDVGFQMTIGPGGVPTIQEVIARMAS